MASYPGKYEDMPKSGDKKSKAKRPADREFWDFLKTGDGLKKAVQGSMKRGQSRDEDKSGSKQKRNPKKSGSRGKSKKKKPKEDDDMRVIPPAVTS